jgi:L-alanine-DL-glutamate epimerase-like enolase superfamily enzyme
MSLDGRARSFIARGALWVGMEIAAVEIHEFTYRIEDASSGGEHLHYEPGSSVEMPGFVLTIRTDTGLEGHYRAFLFTPPMRAQIEMMAQGYLVGRDPLEREGIWQDLWKAFRHTDHLGLGPVDIALWDLAGKHHDASVSTLLGGYRDRVPAYASTFFGDDHPDGLSSPEAYAEFARECLDAGYGAFKLHPFGDPDRDIACCRAVAEAVGDEMDLMLDPSSEYDTYAEAVKVGRALDDLDFLWYEDPMADTGQSMSMHRKLSEELDTHVLNLEHVRTGPFGRADHLAEGAVDMVRADAHLDGGITSVMKIANLVEAFGLDVELHLGGPAHLHCLSAIRNTNYFERGLLHPEIEWMTAQGFEEPVDVVDDDGMVAIPQGPGLGVDIDWDLVEERQTDHTVIDEQGASGLA